MTTRYGRIEVSGRGIVASVVTVLALAGCTMNVGEPMEDGDEQDVLSVQQAQIAELFTNSEVRSWLGSNLCLDVAGGIATPGTNVQIWNCNGSASQKWTQTAAGELRSALAPNLCLDVSGGYNTPGTNVQIWTCNGTPSQQWTATEIGELKSALPTAPCLDVQGGVAAAGTNVQIWWCNGTGSQFFSTRAAGSSNPDGFLVDSISVSAKNVWWQVAPAGGAAIQQPITMPRSGRLKKVFIYGGNRNWNQTINVKIKQGTTIVAETTATVSYANPIDPLIEFNCNLDRWKSSIFAFPMSLPNNAVLQQGVTYTLEIVTLSSSNGQNFSVTLDEGPTVCGSNGLGQVVIPGGPATYVNNSCLLVSLYGELQN